MNMYNKVVQHVFGAILDTCTQLKATSAHYTGTQCNIMQHAIQHKLGQEFDEDGGGGAPVGIVHT